MSIVRLSAEMSDEIDKLRLTVGRLRFADVVEWTLKHPGMAEKALVMIKDMNTQLLEMKRK